jgi:hypothetical protein
MNKKKRFLALGSLFCEKQNGAGSREMQNNPHSAQRTPKIVFFYELFFSLQTA